MASGATLLVTPAEKRRWPVEFHLLATTGVVDHFGAESATQMTSLQRRLLRHAAEVLDPGYPFFGTPELVREAAAEIARLRKQLARRPQVPKRSRARLVQRPRIHRGDSTLIN